MKFYMNYIKKKQLLRAVLLIAFFLFGVNYSVFALGGVLEQLESAFVSVAERVEPAVVNISAERMVKTRIAPFPNFEEEFRGTPFEDFFRFFRTNPDRNERLTSLGSGVIVRKDGYILTNAHVVKDASQITVILHGGESLKAIKIVGMDELTDLAVIKVVPKKPLSHAILGDSDKIRTGSWAIAIGNPFGFSSTLTVGVVSAKGRPLHAEGGITYRDLIQTDASINPGNSGGPLVNIRGEVIGINTAIATPTGGSVGIGFAIPINIAKSVMNDLISKGRVTRGWMGVMIYDLTAEVMRQTGITKGVFVGDIYPKGPADEAGLRQGDIIIEIDGRKVNSVDELQEWVQKMPIGKSIEITILRDKEKMKKTILIKERPVRLEGPASPNLP